MVSHGSPAGSLPPPPDFSDPYWLQRFRVALSRFTRGLPAFVLASASVSLTERIAGLPADLPPAATARVLGIALGGDVLGFLAGLPLLFLLSSPALCIDRDRLRVVAIGLLWSLLLLVQAGLAQYYLSTRVPLGADLFGYSLAEVRMTVVAASAGSTGGGTALLLALLPLVLLWSLLPWLRRRALPYPGARWAAVMLVMAGASLVGERELEALSMPGEDARHYARHKLGFFLSDTAAHVVGRDVRMVGPRDAVVADAERRYLDPAYPFLRAETTPDVLDAHLQPFERPPNLVVIIVEGLGRAFSGPDARLGSFTPFLDELGARSLYFENALAPQGRTFAVLPSLLGSLPFGAEGFSMLGEGMPPHHSLPSLLGEQGYRSLFHAGFDLSFDNTGLFMRRQGTDVVIGLREFGPGYRLPEDAEGWGYPDGELFRRALQDLRAQSGPFVSVIQTVSMHTPYRVPEQARYIARVERHLDALGIPEAERERYRRYRDIYASILYTDDALRDFFAEFARLPAYADTLFVVTGDHRLPELPMDTRLERYHVPLLIHAARLRAPLRIRAVSSHFDVTPSLLAYLSHRHGLRTPPAVTWLGTGLDLSPQFRNRHELPMKQTRTLLDDYVAGERYLSQRRVHAIEPGMSTAPVADAQGLQRLGAEFARFLQANASVRPGRRLMPPELHARRVGWAETERAAPPPDASAGVAIAVEQVDAPARASRGRLEVSVDFANAGTEPAPAFVPLVVLIDAQGRERAEAYGPPVHLDGGGRARVRMPVKAKLPAGSYFIAVLPTDPDTGRRVGTGRYRIPVDLRD